MSTMRSWPSRSSPTSWPGRAGRTTASTRSSPPPATSGTGAPSRTWPCRTRPAPAATTPTAPRRQPAHVLVADPLHEDEIAPDSDGACAVLLADAETVRGEAVWLDGFGFATDVHGLGDRDLGEPGVLPQVAREAYRNAGVQDPDRELDVVEVHDA